MLLKAKDYVSKLLKLESMIRNKLAEKERWMEIATGTTASFGGERVQSSGNKQKMEDAVLKYVGLEREIDECIDTLVDERQGIIATIEQLNATEYNILHQLYVQYYTYDEVAIMNKKSYSWVTTVHGRALQHLQAILDKKEIEQ